MTLHPIPSEFPDIRGKYFISVCSVHKRQKKLNDVQNKVVIVVDSDMYSISARANVKHDILYL
jgi:hypothetical protein